jgi:hypothetical protein
MNKLGFLFVLTTAMLWADFGIQNQLEFHAKYQTLGFGLRDVLTYLRADGAIPLPGQWEMYVRLDIPYMWLWGKEKEVISIGDDGIIVPPEAPDAHTIVKKTPFQEAGLADVGGRFFFVTPGLDQAKSLAIGFGSEFGFPTAQEVDLGTGKYWARPMVGFKWDIPNLGYGSWLAFLLKYQFSFAGHKDRSPFQIFAMQPVFVYPFAPTWTLCFSPEIQYTVRGTAWFVPIAASLTKAFTSHFSLSLSYQKGLVTNFFVFKNEVELTMRYVF